MRAGSEVVGRISAMLTIISFGSERKGRKSVMAEDGGCHEDCRSCVETNDVDWEVRLVIPSDYGHGLNSTLKIT